MNRTEYDDVRLNLIKKSLEKENTEVYIPNERRHGNDSRLIFINLMCFLIWGIVICILAIIEKAGKSISNIVSNDLLWSSSELWQIDLLKLALTVTICSIIICTICILLNLTRYRRRSDKIKKSLIIAEITSFIIGTFLILKLFNF